MSSVIPQTADTLSIPVWDSEQEQGKLTISWQQTYTRTADYYTIVAKNTTQGGGLTLVFIQAEWYNDSGKSNEKHLSHLGKVEDGHVNVKLDDRFQYGQKDSTGNMRFVVYHDQSRNIFQHRFKATSVALMVGGVIEGIAAQWDAAMTAAAVNIGKRFIGNKLHKF